MCIRDRAQREWPGESPIGRQLRPYGMDDDSGKDYATVVGLSLIHISEPTRPY